MTEYDPSPFETNPDVVAGDSAIIFNTQNGGKATLTPGLSPRVGDLIVLHHTNSGELVTHGRSKIKVGDKVILVRGRDGDLYALKSRRNSYRDCQIIHTGTSDFSIINPSPHSDTYKYKKYVIQLERPIQKLPSGAWPNINLRLDFEVEYNNEGFQSWYPYGGVWLGVAEEWTESTDETAEWFWCAGTGSPYPTIAGPPMWEGNTNGENQFCITNWLGGCPLCCPPPFDEINFLQVHIRNTSSLYWGGYVKTRLLYTTICEGEVREGWCDSLRDYGVRDYL